MKLATASSLNMKPIDWLWPGRIPMQCVSLIEGDPGTSKSTLTNTIAAHVSTGRDWPDGEPCPQGAAIIANAEDPEEQVILPRLVAAEANLTQISVIVPSSDQDRTLFTIPDHVELLEKAILEMNVKVVIFDPLEAFLSTKVNNYSNHHIRAALRSLEALAKKVNCAILIVRHLNKDVGKSPTYRGGGSIGVIGAARAAILVTKDPANKSRCLMLPHKANWSSVKDGVAYRTSDTILMTEDGAEIHTSRIVWDGEASISATEALATQVDMKESTTLEEAAQMIRDLLKEGAIESVKVFAEGRKQGYSKKTIYDAAKMVDVIKRPEGHGRNQVWIWELPADITSDFLH